MKLCEIIALRHKVKVTRLAPVAILPETTKHISRFHFSPAGTRSMWRTRCNRPVFLVVILPTVHSLGQSVNRTSFHVTIPATAKVFKWPSVLHRRHIYNNHIRSKSQLHLCMHINRGMHQIKPQSGSVPRIACEWVLDRTQYEYDHAKLLPAYMETKHETVLFDLRVSYRMHNASRAWIIYINKWKESVWCFASPFLFFWHLKGCFFSFVKKKAKTKQTSILERQMADWVKLSLLSKNHTVMEMKVAMEIRKWSNLLDSPERTWW